jgi:hypothetical protein
MDSVLEAAKKAVCKGARVQDMFHHFTSHGSCAAPPATPALCRHERAFSQRCLNTSRRHSLVFVRFCSLPYLLDATPR